MFCPLLLLLYTSAALGHYTYSDQYSEEEYQYGEETEEESVEEFVPVFLSSAHTLTVQKGVKARLECRVERLGPMVITWSRVRGSTTNYLATGSVVLDKNSRLEVEVSESSSVLIIKDARSEDEGEYQCEVSSRPPVHMKLWLKLMAVPEVEILGRPTSGILSVRSGEELALVCQGRGEPQPKLVWRRMDNSLPDGSSSISADQLIFSRVTVSHSGTYICQGGVAAQNVTIQVLHLPLVTLDQSYQHSQEGSALLELVCAVQAVPPARVEWWRGGGSYMRQVKEGGRKRMLYREPGKHVLILERPVQEDLGLYSCSANNTEGTVLVSLDLTDMRTRRSSSNMLEEPTEDPSLSPKISNIMAKSSETPEEWRENPKDENHVEDSHKLLKHIVHKINKSDKLNHDIISAIKESNRFLYQILRNQKKILEEDPISAID